jgi:hypothetical protein
MLSISFRSPHLSGSTPEFVITELALASHSILSLTLSSSSLISPVLESHSPSTIIVQGSLLPHLLELIYEVNKFGQYFVIVIGETDESVISKASKQVRVAYWANIEAQGKAAPTITNPAPGNLISIHFSRISLAQHSLIQIRMMYSPSRSIGTPITRCKLRIHSPKRNCRGH